MLFLPCSSTGGSHNTTGNPGSGGGNVDKQALFRQKNGVISAATLFHINKQALLRQKNGGISAAALFHVSAHSVL